MVAAYALVFLPAYEVRGPSVAALAMIPVAILAYLWGTRVGIVAGVTAFPLHIGLLALGGIDGLAEFAARGGPGQLVLIVVGGAIGRLGDQRRALIERTAELERERATREQREGSYRQLVESSNVIVWELDVSTWRFTFVSPQAEHILGFPAEDWYQADFWPRNLHPADVERATRACAAATARLEDHELQYRMIASDGAEVWLQDIVTVVVENGIPARLRGVMVDITARKRAEEQALWQSLHDPLTGLPNRRLALDRVRNRLQESPTSVAVILLDIDDFRLVNDAIGHVAGDDLLLDMARRLSAAAPPDSTVARVGGDEYAVVMDVVDVTAALAAAEMCHSVFNAAVPMEGREHGLTARVGVTVSQDRIITPEALFAQADAALLDAKQSAPSRPRLFEPYMSSDGRRRLDLEADLRQALADGSLFVHFQPIVDLAFGRIVAVEALARWHHPERNWVAPAEFIPAAERSGLILDVGRLVLDTTCRELVAWHRTDPDLTASINVSTIELISLDFVSRVEATIKRHGLAPSALTLEITETAMISDAQAAGDAVARLRQLGARVVLDDFGTGYDSLNTLKRLTVDGLKLDLGFVQAMSDSPKDAAIVRAILAFGQAVDVEITAEGVETLEQEEHLRRLGCGLAQGYLFGRPVSAEALTAALVANRHAGPSRTTSTVTRPAAGLAAIAQFPQPGATQVTSATKPIGPRARTSRPA